MQDLSCICDLCCSNAGSLTHWSGPGIERSSSQILCQVLNPRATTGTLKCTFLISTYHYFSWTIPFLWVHFPSCFTSVLLEFISLSFCMYLKICIWNCFYSTFSFPCSLFIYVDFYFLPWSWFTVLCQFLLYRKVTQSYIHIYTFFFFFTLSSIMFHHKWLDIVLVLYSRISFPVYSRYNSLHLLTPNSQCIPHSSSPS